MNELLTLYDGDTFHTVFCAIRNIGQKEFYEASALDVYPEIKFVLADYLNYNGEKLLEYNNQMYRVLRTYRTGQELEITVVRASAEEGGSYE